MGVIVHIFCILFITLLHLSCNKSANFLVLNVYFAEDNNEERERIKPKKYQLKSDLTRSIWLAENDPRSSQLKIEFWWINSINLKIYEDITTFRTNQGLEQIFNWRSEHIRKITQMKTDKIQISINPFLLAKDQPKITSNTKSKQKIKGDNPR